jgi:hypothetical protein
MLSSFLLARLQEGAGSVSVPIVRSLRRGNLSTRWQIERGKNQLLSPAIVVMNSGGVSLARLLASKKGLRFTAAVTLPQQPAERKFPERVIFHLRLVSVCSRRQYRYHASLSSNKTEASETADTR